MPRKDPAARKAYQKAYTQQNKEAAYARVKAWREANPEKWAEQRKRYAKKHPDALIEKTIKWRKANPDRAAQIAKRTRIKTKARISANKAKYRATKRNRTPIWLTSFDKLKIRCMYSVALMLSQENNEPWHVDHIVPLNGKLVSGLHVPNNLQVIRGVDNHLKNNKFEVNHA